MEQGKKSGLFEEFPPVSTREWEDKIHEDLKGADYEKRLVWKTPEGLSVKPYYRSEDLEQLPQMGFLPGEAPYVRGFQAGKNQWTIRQDFEETSPREANQMALQAIEKGAEAVGFNASRIESAADLKTMVEGINLNTVAIHLLHGNNHQELLAQLAELDGKAKGSLDFDPLGYYLLYGKFNQSLEDQMNQARKMLETTRENLPGFYPITIGGHHYHNAGASIVQELGFVLAQASEYLAQLTKLGLSADHIAPRIQLTLAVGSNYFMEIAKLRAIKWIWAKMVEAYQPEEEPSCAIKLHAVTSLWNKSVYDSYVNMLRTTTEAMAASIGGVDSMTVEPFDKAFRKPDAFSYRMARNQQIILRHEAHFDKVVDPAGGSYYIENLTHSIAESAWDMFQKIEKMGGFLATEAQESIRKSIEETCQKRDMDIARRKQIFVGTNQYPDPAEKVLDKIEPTSNLSDLAILKQYRGPQSFEALRMAVENHERKGFNKPSVFLFTYGNPAMRKARATFAGNFFGVAGYQIIENLGFPAPEKGVEAALKSKAEIVVLCSSDEEYEALIPAARQIKEAAPSTQLVVAGNPQEFIGALKESGVDQFIHVRTNVLESLQNFNAIMGIY